LLKNENAFELKDGSKFYFDEDMGWYDEFDNYYDKNGKSSTK